MCSSGKVYNKLKNMWEQAQSFGMTNTSSSNHRVNLIDMQQASNTTKSMCSRIKLHINHCNCQTQFSHTTHTGAKYWHEGCGSLKFTLGKNLLPQRSSGAQHYLQRSSVQAYFHSCSFFLSATRQNDFSGALLQTLIQTAIYGSAFPDWI